MCVFFVVYDTRVGMSTGKLPLAVKDENDNRTKTGTRHF